MKAVIFDVDGTLADTEEAHRGAFNATFSHFGLPWEWNVGMYRGLLAVTGGKERIRHYCARFFPMFLDYPNATASIAALHDWKNRLYADLVERGDIAPRPGVLRLIRELRGEGVRLAIATTTSRRNVEALLASTFGALPADTFEVVAAGEDTAEKKPSPEVYQFVLGRLGLAPEDCLAIEDSPNGLLAARAAGLPTLITECPWTSGDSFEGALAVLSDLGEPERHHDVLRAPLGSPGYMDAATLRCWHAAWSGEAVAVQ